MGDNILKTLNERYPFMTICMYAGNEYIGVVQNRDDQVTTLYDFGRIAQVELKARFLELASDWWWESNRSIPINIFLKQEWEPFRPFLLTFNNKDLTILHGPVCSLSNISRRKSKRRSITLVRSLD
jgi:hypothetical protein